MPWTIKQLAEAAGVTKKAMRDRIGREGLWDWHMTKDARGVWQLDDEAAQMLLAKYPVKVKAGTADGAEAEAVRRDYEAKLADMRSVAMQRQQEIDRLRSRIDELGREIDERDSTIKALPAPDAVERAREEGERRGHDSGVSEGREAEREKIAMMGFWKRRKYLREDR